MIDEGIIRIRVGIKIDLRYRARLDEQLAVLQMAPEVPNSQVELMRKIETVDRQKQRGYEYSKQKLRSLFCLRRRNRNVWFFGNRTSFSHGKNCLATRNVW
jgi:hypothetical protein